MLKWFVDSDQSTKEKGHSGPRMLTNFSIKKLSPLKIPKSKI
jgi:hypothetical protein